MAYYVQINELNLAVGVTETSAEIDAPHMIPIGLLDTSILGCTLVDGQWVPPQPEPTPRHISVGAFFDRFEPLKWTILADPSPQVQAVIKDASVRPYIDLDRADLPAGLHVIIDAGYAIDAQAILAAPVQPHEVP